MYINTCTYIHTLMCMIIRFNHDGIHVHLLFITFGLGTFARSSRLWQTVICWNWKGLARESSNILINFSLIHSIYTSNTSHKGAMCVCVCVNQVLPVVVNSFSIYLFSLLNQLETVITKGRSFHKGRLNANNVQTKRATKVHNSWP